MSNWGTTIQAGAARRRTKIIATMGPASSALDRVRELIRAGVNVFRLNFSHGSHESHLAALNTVRAASDELGIPVAVLQDLSGPKIRITDIDGDYAIINDGDEIELRRAASKQDRSGAQQIFVETVNPAEILQAGQPILLADGIITLQAVEVTKQSVRCRIVKGGRIRSRVGIAFPESRIALPAATEKDLRDLKWGLEHKVDFVAISFVQNARDIQMVREVMLAAGYVVPIIAKIERRAALENLREILEACDGLMVARGDLGLELPVEQLPRVQRMLIEQANAYGVPAIVATQMLHSMITAVRPTRAEVTDIATAVMTGADAVMLSEETTIGENPVECVRYLGKIAHEAEHGFQFDEFKVRLKHVDRLAVPDAIAYAACAAAVKINAAAIIACTETGTSARLVAKYRPQQSLYGTSARPETLRRMCLYWGVIPIPCDTAVNRGDEIRIAIETVQRLESLPNGSKAVITGGNLVGTPGATSVMEVQEMNFLPGSDED